MGWTGTGALALLRVGRGMLHRGFQYSNIRIFEYPRAVMQVRGESGKTNQLAIKSHKAHSSSGPPGVEAKDRQVHFRSPNGSAKRSAQRIENETGHIFSALFVHPPTVAQLKCN